MISSCEQYLQITELLIILQVSDDTIQSQTRWLTDRNKETEWNKSVILSPKDITSITRSNKQVLGVTQNLRTYD